MRTPRIPSPLPLLLLAAFLAPSARAADVTLPTRSVARPTGPHMAKIAGTLQIQTLQKRAYLKNPSPGAFAALEAHDLTGRPLDRILVDLRLDAFPSGEVRSRLEALGVVLHERTWLPPFGGHAAGQIFAEIPLESVYEVAKIPAVREMRSGEAVDHPHNDLAAGDMQADLLWAGSMTGAGVRVGILDSGLEEAHADVPTPTVKRDYSAWPTIDMTIGNTVTGHGTHVTGSVLGRGTLSGGTYKGMAHGADLVFIKIGSDATAGASFAAESNAIRACVDSFGCDVITMSYGGWDDYHDGSSSPAVAADYAWSQGAVVLFSAGNDGNGGEHFSGNVAASSTSPFIQVDALDVPTSSSVALYFNLVWFDGPAVSNNLELQFFDVAMNPIPFTAAAQSQNSRGTESQYFNYNFFLPAGTSTWFVRVVNNSGNAQDYHIFASRLLNTIGGTYVTFAAPDPDYTVSSPANSDSAIAVAAHVTRSSWIAYDGTGPWTFGYTSGAIAPFSSHGPTVMNAQKPQISGPGSAIVSLRDHPMVPTGGSSDPLIIDNDGTNDGLPADYLISQGTSMSCPLVAGSVALLKEGNPAMTPALARHWIQGLARTDASTGTVPNNTWGYGKMDAGAILPFLSVEQVQFFFRVEGSEVVLRWTTAGERNTEGFRVLRSESGDERFVRVNEILIPSAAGPDGSGEYELRDRGARPGKTYYYKVIEVERNGATKEHGPFTVSLALPFALAQNVPNPFNPTTTISYSLPRDEHVTLKVYDTSGRTVRTLARRIERAGRYDVVWDGTDDSGRAVASGVYFYRLDAGKRTETKKMLLVK